MKAVEKIVVDLIPFTTSLIRIPSLTGQEKEMAETVLRKLQEIGLDEAWIDGIGNVIGVLFGAGEGPNILLTGHLDVVPAGRVENWRHDPFGGEIDADRNLHGRGTVDMKGGLAASIFTMQIFKGLKERGIQLPGNLIFSGVVYEEAAEMLGMEYLVTKTLPEKGLGFDVCYLAEPTSGRIHLGHRGKVELVLTTRGRTAHSSAPWMGINALEKMTPVLEHIFNKVGPNLPSHPQLGKCSITITNLVCRPGTLSIIPDECEISIDRRYLPGEDLPGILRTFETLFTELKAGDPDFDASIRVRTFLETSYTGYQKEVQKHHPVWILETDHPFVQKTKQALQRIGLPAEVGYWRGGTDASMTAGLMGIPTIGYSGADESLAHTPEEHIPLRVLVEDVEAYASILCEIYGIDLSEMDN